MKKSRKADNTLALFESNFRHALQLRTSAFLVHRLISAHLANGGTTSSAIRVAPAMKPLHAESPSRLLDAVAADNEPICKKESRMLCTVLCTLGSGGLTNLGPCSKPLSLQVRPSRIIPRSASLSKLFHVHITYCNCHHISLRHRPSFRRTLSFTKSLLREQQLWG